ncbi:chloroplast-targeted copper chaperone [Dorcoceras hygrometricum]|uniref:Chloroplast-targeted copper chaperone n=1 Tax=Dorcoceras hygrometricum TaxID=472368 RepID=A0A2Z7CJU7_9LAMI|nr:chloroplast-targeted copper chaperone [Dorcoceras hygrometricum]
MQGNKATTESREPKDLNSCSTNESDQLNNSGHGVWELPTPLIVANRSQQGDEVYGSYPLVLKTSILLADNNTTEASNNSTGAYTEESTITHAQSKAVKNSHIRTSTVRTEIEKINLVGINRILEISGPSNLCLEVWLISRFLGTFSCNNCFTESIRYGSELDDTRTSGNTTLSSPCWDLLATMRRVVNYHSSWARQQQVELFVASAFSCYPVSHA